jgi:phospholipid transport system substrate-binding protein
MARRHPVFIACATVLGLWVLRPAAASEPADQLKAAVDQVIKILEDPSLKASGKGEARREAIRRTTDGLFDWEETARQSLGPHWRQRTDVERRQFVALFRELLERTYLSKIELYSGEKITYGGDSVDGDMATVRTVMLTKKQQEVPIDYRMIRRGNRWLVYDVAVEGVSLVSNYRGQFNDIIRTASYPALVRKMEAKIAEIKP